MINLKIIFCILPVFSAISLGAAEKPYGLLTDLIEHTDRTWQNGYESGLPVWRMGEAIEPLQFAAIGSRFPAFSWIVPRNGQGTRQTAYRIILCDSMEEAANGVGNVWDSGEVHSAGSVGVVYGGQALEPDRNYFWRVKSFTDTGGESEWSGVKAFRTATELTDYSAAYYPQVKMMQHPVGVINIGERVFAGDFGRDAFGQLMVTLHSNSATDTVLIHLGEKIRDGRIDRNPGGTIRYHRYELPLMKGTHTYRIKIRSDKRNTGPAAIPMPPYIGEVVPFRYVEIEGYAGQLTANDILREYVYYPFDETASDFSSSDPVLNQIWELCKYSIPATSYVGIYVDGDRERIPYEADALINQLCHYGADREFSIARRSLEYLLLHPTWPTEWALQTVMIAWYDYLYTGDDRLLRQYYDRLKVHVLFALVDESGFVSTRTGLQTKEFKTNLRNLRDIVDWPQPGETDGFEFTDYNAVVNAFHFQAVKFLAEIAEVLGYDEDRKLYAAYTEDFRRNFNKHFLDRKTGAYRDGITSDHSALHSNMMPLAFGMADKRDRRAVADFVKSRGMACSVYGSQFLMDGLYEAGQADYALELLTSQQERSWYNMIRVGSTITLEAWDDKFKPNQDWNHAWGAVPGNIIPRKLMGVEPLEPGFATARIMPQTGSLEWAKAKIPTVRGEILMEVENGATAYTVKLSLPANMEAELYLPFTHTKKTVTVNGRRAAVAKLKDEPFLYVGKIAPGDWTIRYEK